MEKVLYYIDIIFFYNINKSPYTSSYLFFDHVGESQMFQQLGYAQNFFNINHNLFLLISCSFSVDICFLKILKILIQNFNFMNYKINYFT